MGVSGPVVELTVETGTKTSLIRCVQDNTLLVQISHIDTKLYLSYIIPNPCEQKPFARRNETLDV